MYSASLYIRTYIHSTVHTYNEPNLKLRVEEDQLNLSLQINCCFGQGVTQTTDSVRLGYVGTYIMVGNFGPFTVGFKELIVSEEIDLWKHQQSSCDILLRILHTDR